MTSAAATVIEVDPRRCLTVAKEVVALELSVAGDNEDQPRIHAASGPPFACPRCPKVYISSSNLSDHLREHHHEGAHRTFTCNICGDTFAQSANLLQHKRANHGGGRGRPHRCDACGAGFKHMETLQRHRKKMHSGADAVVVVEDDATDDELVVDFNEEAVTDRDEDSLCVGQFKEETSDDDEDDSEDAEDAEAKLENNLKEAFGLYFGVRSVEDREGESRKTEEKFITPWPNGNDDLPVNDHRHLLVNSVQKAQGEESVQPVKRSRRGRKPRQLAYDDGDDEEFVAKKKPKAKVKLPKARVTSDNGQATSSGSDLPFKCSECPKAFATRGLLRLHARVHTGERPHKCDICSRTFRLSHHLVDHRRGAHTGERPYACDDCGRKFSQSGNLLAHRRRAHGTAGGPAHACSTCNRRFAFACELRKHLSTAHGQEDDGEDMATSYPCSRCGRVYAFYGHLQSHLEKCSQT